MEHEVSKMKALIHDWRWIVGVSVLLAIPTYGFTAPMRYAVAAHVVATLAYVGLLLLFGPGAVLEGAAAVLILATLFAFCSRPLHRIIHRETVSIHETWSNKSLQPTAVGRLSSAFAVDIAARRWLSSGR